MTRGFLQRAGRCLVIVLLLAQWAVVTHACQPFDAVAQAVAAAAAHAQADAETAAPLASALPTDDATMVDCASMDSMQAHVQDASCAAHCGYGDQGDRHAAPVLPAVSLSVAYFLVTAPEAHLPRRTPATVAHALAVATPAHAILHCVRRT